MKAEPQKIGPQPGPQTAFLASPADIAIYGGAAGGGKTFALLLDPLRAVHLPGFAGVFFRRESTQISAAGGPWSAAEELYRATGATLRSSPSMEARWPSGAVVQFRHLQHESDKFAWQGAELAAIMLDELTHFSSDQFWYLISRNRSTCGVRPWIRATCNPQPGWVAELIEWWIGPDGYAIPERSGVLRWFVRRDDDLHWYDTEAEALTHCAEGQFPRSLTFIRSTLEDNPILTSADPAYRSALLSLPRVERERLLLGNWQVSMAAGVYRHARWVYSDAGEIPVNLRWVRSWDLASTEPHAGNPNPDWTAGALVARHRGRDGVVRTYVSDVRRCRLGPSGVENFVRQTAEQDGPTVEIVMEEEPGSAGKGQVEHYQRTVLRGYRVTGHRPTGDKVTRQMPLIAEAERGEIVFLRGSWNAALTGEADTYPEGKRDQWDAIAQAHGVAPVTTEIRGASVASVKPLRRSLGAVRPPSRM